MEGLIQEKIYRKINNQSQNKHSAKIKTEWMNLILHNTKVQKYHLEILI
jgi:hypothetical protein